MTARYAVVCGAKRKSDGKPCQNSPAIGAKRCRFHGGKSLKGAANPTYKTGKTSRYNNLGKYAQGVGKFIEDEEILTLFSELAIVRARLQELATLAGADENQPDWVGLQRQWSIFKSAQISKNQKTMSKALSEIDRLIEQGSSQSALWTDIDKTLQRVQSLTESERRRQQESLETVKVSVIMKGVNLFFEALIEMVRTHVPDKELRRTIILGANDVYSKAISASATSE